MPFGPRFIPIGAVRPKARRYDPSCVNDSIRTCVGKHSPRLHIAFACPLPMTHQLGRHKVPFCAIHLLRHSVVLPTGSVRPGPAAAPAAAPPAPAPAAPPAQEKSKQTTIRQQLSRLHSRQTEAEVRSQGSWATTASQQSHCRDGGIQQSDYKPKLHTHSSFVQLLQQKHPRAQPTHTAGQTTARTAQQAPGKLASSLAEHARR